MFEQLSDKYIRVASIHYTYTEQVERATETSQTFQMSNYIYIYNCSFERLGGVQSSILIVLHESPVCVACLCQLCESVCRSVVCVSCVDQLCESVV